MTSKTKKTTPPAARRRSTKSVAATRRAVPGYFTPEQGRMMRKWAADIVGRLPQELGDAIYVLRCAEDLMIDWVALDDIPLPKGKRAAR